MTVNSGNKNKKQNKEELELDKETRDIFFKAVEEAEKIKKSKTKQDISCGKVVCHINRKEEKKHKQK
jgi:hypothetical protein